MIIGGAAATLAFYFQLSDRQAQAAREFNAAVEYLGGKQRGPNEVSFGFYEARRGRRTDPVLSDSELAKAWQSIAEFERLRPFDARSNFLRFVYHTKRDDLRSAESELQAFASSADEDAIYTWMLLLAAKLDPNPSRARQLFNKALLKAPHDAYLLITYGVHLHSQNENKEALTYLRRALAMDQDNPVAINAVVHVLTEDDQVHAAIDLAKHALRRGLRYPELNNSLGYAYWLESDYHNAVREFGQAAETAPREWVYLQNLSLALEKIGDPEEAIKTLDRAKRLGLPDQDFYKSGQPNGRI